ncbi:nucleolar protein 6-like [Ctenocephalides felis]|uniref:nucleolar protein 6-like n=1 Tax=Ctenocephalides felis TaxID=7515 RepID=UPI000E6E4399|nr:nucleolar protein 6-like [Ctenocephalides felis]
MLSEVKLKSKYVKLFTTWYEEFASVIGSLKDKKNEYEISDLIWLESMNVKFPISVDSRESKGVFKFYKPASVNIVGSYNLNVTLGSIVNIDISVEMPKKMFQKMDYLNQRYHKKRAMYLCHIANKLQKSKLLKSLNSSTKKNWFTGDGSEDSEAGEATPRYNFSVLQDLARSENEALRLSVFDKNQNLKDANSMLHEHGISLYSGELKENQPSLLEFDSIMM